MSIEVCVSEPRAVANLPVERSHPGPSTARLQAFAACERLLEPITRLTSVLEAPPSAFKAWCDLAPAPARALSSTLDELRPLVSAPHLLQLVRLLGRLLTASSPSDWAEVEALAVAQNGLALESDEAHVVLASLFWTEAGTAWPAIYLVRKEGTPDAEAAQIDELARYFAKLDASRPAPRILFATNLAFGPAKAAANAFALHNQAAVVFEVVDPERLRLSRGLAQRLGVSAEDAARVGRLFVSGHEFGHKYDPLTLPVWTEELFADVAGFVACAASSNVPRDLLLRIFLLETLLNYARPLHDRASHPYFESSDYLIDRLVHLGALSVAPPGSTASSAPIVLSDAAWDHVLRDFEQTFEQLRQGRCPEHLRPGRRVYGGGSSAETRALFDVVHSVLAGRAEGCVTDPTWRRAVPLRAVG